MLQEVISKVSLKHTSVPHDGHETFQWGRCFQSTLVPFVSLKRKKTDTTSALDTPEKEAPQPGHDRRRRVSKRFLSHGHDNR